MLREVPEVSFKLCNYQPHNVLKPKMETGKKIKEVVSTFRTQAYSE